MKKLTGYILLSVMIFLCAVSLSCAKQQNENMVLVNGGTFAMGSPSSEIDRDIDEMQRQITVSSFYIGIYQVTQAEYIDIMKKNHSKFKGEKLPVESISWYHAIEYCNRLSQSRGLNPVYLIEEKGIMWDRGANGYRLPTEAEWEYACRAGTSTPFNTGDNLTTSQANYDGNYPYNNGGQGEFLEKTVPVGSYPANSFGLFDMHGNVFEWCWDWHDYYRHDTEPDPIGPASGSYRVIRGGSWTNGAKTLRSASRGIYIPGDGNERIGLRLVRNVR